MQTPVLIQRFFPSITWTIPVKEKKIFLTFDDGPIPEVTPWVLDVLKSYNAKATFFCIGNNVAKYPSIYGEIIDQGHQTGNHTHNHMNGWKVRSKDYYDDIERCSEFVNSKLFRPPYGKITFPQIRHLKRKYKLIMWDVLSKDYSQKMSADQCLQKVINEVRPGSIIVFHDSLKAEKQLRGALPGIMEHFKNEGYKFSRIED